MLKKNAEKIESMLKKLKISWQNASEKKTWHNTDPPKLAHWFRIIWKSWTQYRIPTLIRILHYKAFTKYFPVLLCTAQLPQSTSQYYFVLQSLHKALLSTALYYIHRLHKYFPTQIKTLHTASFYTQKTFTHRSFFTWQAFTHSIFLHRETLTHSKRIHTKDFTHFYTQHAFPQRNFYTQQACTQKFWHTAVFTQGSFYTKKTFTQKVFTHRRLLHTARF